MKISVASLLLSLAASSSAFAPSISSAPAAAATTSTQLFERKTFITGNWKLNPQTKAEALELATGIANAVTPGSPCDVALFVPFPFIEPVQKAVGDKLKVGAEMVTPEMAGAFTGGISAPMLESIGVEWALAGHSERRTINKETDEYINAQCVKLIEQGMSVILCIGETLEEFEKDLVGAVCETQLKKGLAGISAEDMSRVAIACELLRRGDGDWAFGFVLSHLSVCAVLVLKCACAAILEARSISQISISALLFPL